MPTVIENDINSPLNTTLRVQLSDGTDYDVANIATDIVPKSATLIRGADETVLDATLIVIDKNSDSQTGQYNVLLELANIQDAATNTVQELQHDDKVKILVDVTTPDGSRTWVRVFDIDDPSVAKDFKVNVIAPLKNEPRLNSGGSGGDYLHPIVFSLHDTDGENVLGLASVLNAFTQVKADGSVIPLGTSYQFDEPTPGVYRMVFDASIGFENPNTGDPAVFEDGDVVRASLKNAIGATPEFAKEFVIPIIAPLVTGPRVF